MKERQAWTWEEEIPPNNRCSQCWYCKSTHIFCNAPRFKTYVLVMQYHLVLLFIVYHSISLHVMKVCTISPQTMSTSVSEILFRGFKPVWIRCHCLMHASCTIWIWIPFTARGVGWGDQVGALERTIIFYTLVLVFTCNQVSLHPFPWLCERVEYSCICCVLPEILMTKLRPFSTVMSFQNHAPDID